MRLKGRTGMLLQSDRTIESIKKKYPNVTILDRMNYICNYKNNSCYSINDKFEKYFYDYGHYTLAGARFFGQQIDRIGWLNPLYKEIGLN
jgi:hypothetical protein